MLRRNPVVAIVRSKRAIDVESVVAALFDGGLEAVEVTLTTPGALAAIERVSAKLPPDLWLGCGSVTNVDAARRALSSGARFLVAPTIDHETMAYAVGDDKPIFPGAYTPTEILQAANLGAECVKLFPAESLGPAYVEALLAPMPELRIMPTGGVTLQNVDDWRAAGATAVGVGKSLFHPEWAETADYASIRKSAEEWTGRTEGWL